MEHTGIANPSRTTDSSALHENENRTKGKAHN